jgi:hypothetical protein
MFDVQLNQTSLLTPVRPKKRQIASFWPVVPVVPVV